MSAASRDLIGAVHWCPTGDPMDGKPGEVLRLLATDGMPHGYGYAPGWAMAFGTEAGLVSLLPGQWIARYADGTVSVSDCDPREDQP